MPKTYKIDDIKVDVTHPLGVGGQGKAEKAVVSDDPNVELALKRLPYSRDTHKRVKAIIDRELVLHSPYLAAPFASRVVGDEILHLAPFADGHELTEDNRTFPENMELAYQLMCQLTILEEQGVTHGDLAPSNIMISDTGEVWPIDFDNARIAASHVPPPTMRGQHMMLAPELRGAGGRSPNQGSDRFAYGVLMNLLLLRRHPAGDVSTPDELDDIMSKGRWPERDHILQSGQVPLASVGENLLHHFDQSFSLKPHKRPSADHWREAVSDALVRMVIHDCGQAFVLDDAQTQCPWCHGSLDETMPSRIRQIKINVPSISARYGVALNDHTPVILGRGNLVPSAQTVSSKHLEITPMGDRLFLRHIGRNPTLILENGKWKRVTEISIDLSDLQTAPITLKLADLMIDIGL